MTEIICKPGGFPGDFATMSGFQSTDAPSSRRWRSFGEQVPGYEEPVLNERAVRAAAGMLFALALVAFLNAWLLGNFRPTQVFVVAFLIDFAVRLFISPRLAPSLVVGQWVVRKQQAEWVAAEPKRFAWAIGFVLALVMAELVVRRQVIGPVNLVICASCLTLLFFESAFGICLGCRLYAFWRGTPPRYCPGGVCAAPSGPTTRPAGAAVAVLLAFVVAVVSTAQWVYDRTPPPREARTAAQPATAAPASTLDPAEAARCQVPDYAKAMGHEALWKLHNHCQ